MRIRVLMFVIMFGVRMLVFVARMIMFLVRV